MSRLIRSTVVMILFGLATASFAFGQRQPSGSSTSSQDRKSGQSGQSSTGSGTSSSSSSDRASTAGDRNRAGSDGQASSQGKRATFEVYKDRSGEYRWRLRANNSQILAMAAQGYSDKRAAMNAIESVKRDVASAPIEEKEQTAASGDQNGQSDSATTAGERSGSGSSSGRSGRSSTGTGTGTGSGTGTGTGTGSGSGSSSTSGNRNR